MSQIYFIWSNTLHVSEGLSVHHQEFKTVYTATGISQTDTVDCLLASSRQYLFDTGASSWFYYRNCLAHRKTQLLHITLLCKCFTINKIATKYVTFKSLKKRQASLQFHFKCFCVESWCWSERAEICSLQIYSCVRRRLEWAVSDC
jgi:hypothetical protein